MNKIIFQKPWSILSSKNRKEELNKKDTVYSPAELTTVGTDLFNLLADVGKDLNSLEPLDAEIYTYWDFLLHETDLLLKDLNYFQRGKLVNHFKKFQNLSAFDGSGLIMIVINLHITLINNVIQDWAAYVEDNSAGSFDTSMASFILDNLINCQKLLFENTQVYLIDTAFALLQSKNSQFLTNYCSDLRVPDHAKKYLKMLLEKE